MADKGFNMPPSQRREPKRFEPPPWERDAFDELERKRIEAEQAGRPEAPGENEEPPADGGQGGTDRGEPAAAQGGPQDGEPKGAARTSGKPGSAESDAAGACAEGGTEAQASVKPDVEDKQVAAMLLELAAEEPRADNAISTITLAVAVVLFALGAMMIMWGMAGFVAARAAGGQAVAAAGVLFLFGAGFVAGGIYLAVKSLQKRGVL